MFLEIRIISDGSGCSPICYDEGEWTQTGAGSAGEAACEGINFSLRKTRFTKVIVIILGHTTERHAVVHTNLNLSKSKETVFLDFPKIFD